MSARMSKTSITTIPRSQPDSAPAVAAADDPQARESVWRTTLRQLRPAIVATLVITLITGVIYPLVVMGLGQAIFPSQANGSIIYVNGKPVASSVIGEYWTQARYFHGRP